MYKARRYMIDVQTHKYYFISPSSLTSYLRAVCIVYLSVPILHLHLQQVDYIPVGRVLRLGKLSCTEASAYSMSLTERARRLSLNRQRELVKKNKKFIAAARRRRLCLPKCTSEVLFNVFFHLPKTLSLSLSVCLSFSSLSVPISDTIPQYYTISTFYYQLFHRGNRLHPSSNGF